MAGGTGIGSPVNASTAKNRRLLLSENVFGYVRANGPAGDQSPMKHGCTAVLQLSLAHPFGV